MFRVRFRGKVFFLFSDGPPFGGPNKVPMVFHDPLQVVFRDKHVDRALNFISPPSSITLPLVRSRFPETHIHYRLTFLLVIIPRSINV